MNGRLCPDCGHRFGWRELGRQLLALGRRGRALWSVTCPACAAELKVASWRVWAIVLLAVVFGTQTASLTVLGDFTTFEAMVIKLALIIGSYLLGAFFLLKLDRA
jgi:hypothetical protein